MHKFEKLLRQKLGNKIIKNDKFAQLVYCALCNVTWINKDNSDSYSCSWRYAGGIIADIRDKGEIYLDYYCSGHEGTVDPSVLKEIKKFGYSPQIENTPDDIYNN